MVAHSSSLWMIAHLIPSQLLPLLMHAGKQLAAMLVAKRLVGVVPEGMNLRRECTLQFPPQKQIRHNPL